MFSDAAALAEAVCAAAYACPADCDWPMLARMLDHAGAALRAGGGPGESGARAAGADQDGWEDWDDAGGAPAQPQATAEARVQEVGASVLPHCWGHHLRSVCRWSCTCTR